MTRFKSSNIIQSLKNAIHGLNLAVSSQRNFRIELIIAVFVMLAAVFLKFSLTDICILMITITMVLICELLNSVIEFTLDSVYKNNYSKLAAMAKDISAGMVLLCAFISVITGILLFSDYILK